MLANFDRNRTYTGGVVGDDHKGFTLGGFDFSLQPFSGLSVPDNGVRGFDFAVAGADPDLTVVCHGQLSPGDGCVDLIQQRKIGPEGAPQKSNAVDADRLVFAAARATGT